jgi:hypothetical protein
MSHEKAQKKSHKRHNADASLLAVPSINLFVPFVSFVGFVGFVVRMSNE